MGYVLSNGSMLLNDATQRRDDSRTSTPPTHNQHIHANTNAFLGKEKKKNLKPFETVTDVEAQKNTCSVDSGI